ncbi:hypothetical protein [Achromobacter sp. UBA4530]|uniref:hypothetical protein n=1 Tax=Achromobacter sp. UBA4530 TaxID=1945912 RepID=UPI00257B2930|nr:hypothetical protein [Achromobacter sp. UBA4530]
MKDAITETERLLIQAQEIATRRLETASENAVLNIFKELCEERDRTAWAVDGRECATMH